MDFRKFPPILAVFLVTVLIVQPVLSATTVTPEDVKNDAAIGLFNSAEVLVEHGDYENAIKLFDQSLASNTTMLNKTDALLYLYRDKGYALIKLGKYNEAMATLDEGLVLYPEDAMLWNNKGFALKSLGKTQDALTAYDRSISFDRNYTNAYINRGDVLIQMGRYTDAVAAYTRANETDPFNVASSYGLVAARKGEAGSTQAITILIIIVFIVTAGIVVWYVKFRKPAGPAPDEKVAKSKK
jgi:tetratricopeptide (TPR) repeat protein